MPNIDFDPTGLMTLRRTVASEISGRFNALATQIRRLVDTEDAFGLRDTGDGLVSNAASQRWRFLTAPQKVEAFRDWLQRGVTEGTLRTDPGVDQPWLSRHIQSAYLSGVGRSYMDAQAALLLPSQLRELGRAQFLSQALTSPVATNSLQLMYTRNFTQLRGVTDKMSATMSVILTEELVKGSGPQKMVQRLVKEVGLSRNRAIGIAQTELTYVQAEGQLDGYVAAGIGETVQLKVLVEWLTAFAPCSACAAVRGVVFTIKEARGKIPLHPRCRCAWGPVNIYEPATPGQKRSKKAIAAAIAESLKQATRKKTLTEARKASKWAGASLKPTGKRQLKLPRITAADVTAPPPKLSEPKPVERTKPTGPVYDVTKLKGRITRGKSKGTPVAVGNDAKNNTATVSATKTPTGSVTQVHIPLTPEGSAKVVKTLGADFEAERLKFRDRDIHPLDAQFKTIESVARMVDARATDGKYNQIALSNAQLRLKTLQGIASGDFPASTEERAIAKHYVPQMEAVLQAYQKKTPTPAIVPYRPAPNALAPTHKAPFPVSKGELRLPVKQLDQGAVTAVTGGSRVVRGDSYTITPPGGVSVQFTPTATGEGSKNPATGSLTIQIPGKATPERVQQGLAVAQGLGISVKPVSPAREELTYLTSVLEARGDGGRRELGVILRNPLLTDQQKVTRVKVWVQQTAKVDLKNPPPQYNPQGRTLSGDGTGPRVWDRWDIDPIQVKAGLTGFVLQHTTGGLGDASQSSVPVLIQNTLKSGGVLLPPLERARQGLKVSPSLDLSTPPAGVVSTRIQRIAATLTSAGLYFKPTSLIRTDALVLTGLSAKPVQSLTGWITASAVPTNVATFAAGLDLLGELELIRVRSRRDYLQVLRLFAASGVTQLPDGRNIADIVVELGSLKPHTPSK